jgi:methionine-rich copper-binding protein CopC
MTLRARKPLFVAGMSALILLVLTALPTAASAHDHLVSSTPNSGATLAALPKSVVLHFEEPPVAGYTKVSVVDAAGHAITKAAPVTSGSTVTLALPASTATGRFTIVWSALSDDGHPVSGTIGFAVAGKAKRSAVAAPATKQVAETTTVRHGRSLGWLAAAAVGIAVLASIFVLFGRRERT